MRKPVGYGVECDELDRRESTAVGERNEGPTVTIDFFRPLHLLSLNMPDSFVSNSYRDMSQKAGVTKRETARFN